MRPSEIHDLLNRKIIWRRQTHEIADLSDVGVRFTGEELVRQDEHGISSEDVVIH